MNPIYSKHIQLSGDTITPISCFLNLRDVYATPALFESSDYLSKENSKSFICAEPIASFSVHDGKKTLRIGKVTEKIEEDDLAKAFELVRDKFRFLKNDILALNGFFGAVAYDAIPQVESIDFKEKTRFQDLPEVHFSIYKYLVVFDNFTNKVALIMNTLDEDFSGFDAFHSAIFHAKIHRAKFSLTGEVISNETDESFTEKVNHAKAFTRKGDVFQLVISRAFEQAYSGDEFEVYRQLRTINPSPYMFYFELPNGSLFGASPEAQFRAVKGLAEIHPIAGTIKRTGNIEKDQQLTKKLSSDVKENAEHTMLVDLARNDLNITCADVKVEAYKKIQTFSHVIHMVSKVTGQLKNNESIQAFAKSFPAGTLSGAPKFRAMELIDQMEADNRGFYGGAIGHLAPNGDLNTAIVIRSCLAYQGKLFYQAGAGVVLDSIPKNEVLEVKNKIKAVQKAIELAATLNSQT